ncbi:hypothetical protein AYO44_08765 [Planctomycetaceae bacterium SCGC AG-212-F19]|nr:hypothetical protein AYO44_08765 [Planctomycetaceae bacterium SCGC AG-212-F19]
MHDDRPVVVKVGGSLFELPDLAPRLGAWLSQLACPRVLLVPGGGAAADVVRRLDQVHHLGEEVSHWLALRAMTLSAHFLAGLLPTGRVVRSLGECPAVWASQQFPILDAHVFALADEGQPGCLPYRWEVTSDSIAARVAVIAGAGRLILLKSIDIPVGTDWAEGGRRGWVDGYFGEVLKGSELVVEAVNLRQGLVARARD